jgi:hypothetical protein
MLHTTSLAEMPRRRPKEVDEYEFGDVPELCAFVAGEIIRCHLSYKDLAAKAHVCVATVSRLASGDTQFPRAATLFGILNALGYTVVVRR